MVFGRLLLQHRVVSSTCCVADKELTVLPSRRFLPCASLVAATAAIVLVAASARTVGAQARLDARYTGSLAGVTLGKGAWVVDIGETQFTAAASGMTAGLLRVFSSGQGTGASRGAINGNHFVPTSYSATIITDNRTEEVRLTLNGGLVKDFAVTPPTPPHSKRIPLTDADRRGVLDPMSASLVRVPGNGEVLDPDSCRRHVAIFDGRMRYDLDLAFKRMENVKSEKGYAGPVLVCSINFTPIAGHIPDRTAIKYIAKLQDMEVWLAPVAGVRVLVPFRVQIPTPLGLALLEATQFIVIPQPTRASVKTQ